MGIDGKTNHSLRVTSATRMYKGGIPERMIQARTGHKSIEALRVYERPGMEQNIQACKALANITNQDLSKSNDHIPCSSNSTSTASSFQNMSNASAPNFVFNNCTVTLYTGNVNQ